MTISAEAKLLHAAIANNDWPSAQSILNEYGALVGRIKNPTGSTPLMLAANGKCGKNNHLLVELLLQDGNGGKESAAERNRKGKTAADIAEELGNIELSKRLRALENDALTNEQSKGLQRCTRCKAKLKSRSSLAFVRDCIVKGTEKNDLLLELFNEHPLAMNRLDVPALHRVNCCLSFRKELTESMALVSELKMLRSNAETVTLCSVGESEEPLSWKGWHIVDLCSGAQCVTAALCLSILPGVSVTALDIVPSKELPHFEDVDWTRVMAVGNAEDDGDNNVTNNREEGTVSSNNTTDDDNVSSFSYMQRDIHDSDLAQQLKSHINTQSNANGTTTTYTGNKVIVLAMHCCGALSQRAICLFEELDATSILVMPCCLPPKNLGWSKKRRTFDPKLASTSWNPCGENGGRDEAETKAMAEIFASKDPDEQCQRWARYLRRRVVEVAMGDQKGDNEAGNIGVERTNHDVTTKLREVDAVLSDPNTLITGIRKRGALGNSV